VTIPAFDKLPTAARQRRIGYPTSLVRYKQRQIKIISGLDLLLKGKIPGKKVLFLIKFIKIR
jgi:hypothetical protein